MHTGGSCIDLSLKFTVSDKVDVLMVAHLQREHFTIFIIYSTLFSPIYRESYYTCFSRTLCLEKALITYIYNTVTEWHNALPIKVGTSWDDLASHINLYTKVTCIPIISYKKHARQSPLSQVYIRHGMWKIHKPHDHMCGKFLVYETYIYIDETTTQ